MLEPEISYVVYCFIYFILQISKLENEVHLHELDKLTLKEDNKSIDEQRQKFEIQVTFVSGYAVRKGKTN